MAKAQGVRWKAIELRDEKRVTAGLAHHRRPAWSPDGRWLAFAAGDGADASWVLADRRGHVARVLGGPAVGGAAIGPAGQIAIGRRVGESSEIWMAASPALPAVRLLGGDGRSYRDPAFSPDGTKLAFAVAERGRPASLALLELSTGTRQPLPSDPQRSDGSPAFSPDGRLLYFEGLREGEPQCWSLDLVGGGLLRVTAEGKPSRSPAPIAEHVIVVEREAEGKTQLVLVDCEAMRERELWPQGRHPAAAGGSKVRLAFVERDERDEIVVARVKGVTADESDEPEAIRA
jgi:dipeptidyl aminopeptidase/acylaminoacyl peptidase